MNTVAPTELLDFLKSKGINRLYCATTVKTACSIINSGKLMSKHKLDLNKLPMTGAEDANFYKSVNLWNKIILSLFDLHGYLPRQNKFGPVCFVLNVELLSEINIRDLRISKKNPMYFKDTPKYKRFFSSFEDFAQNYDWIIDEQKANRTLILLRDKKSTVDLNKYLVEVILDKPEERHLLFTKAKKAVSSTLEASGLKAPLKIREDNDFCFCQFNYNLMKEDEMNILFNPSAMSQSE